MKPGLSRRLATAEPDQTVLMRMNGTLPLQR
jgi:hypothetical protein